VPSCTLHAARRIQFWKQSDQHAPSLPCTRRVSQVARLVVASETVN
jgi:hypothetical protein